MNFRLNDKKKDFFAVFWSHENDQQDWERFENLIFTYASSFALLAQIQMTFQKEGEREGEREGGS